MPPRNDESRYRGWHPTRHDTRHRAFDEGGVPGRTERSVTFESAELRMPNVSGGNIEKAIPDPIPNSEVKLLGADGTARATVWESRTLPG